ncbi:MAG: ATP-binding cassette domain-containing protein [Lachnospiraceae bacterium]|nr:ATP-binding cassette domain-containing protein [Lachnospiraceae bacterium]
MLLTLSHVKKAFPEETVIKDATFMIDSRERAALVGPNGAGKTTILRMIMGELEPDEGGIYLDRAATVGYLRQHDELRSQLTVWNEVLSVRERAFQIERESRELEEQMAKASSSELPALLSRHDELAEAFRKENGYAIESELKGVLRGLGFTEEDFGKPVPALSGGEKTRVELAKLLLLSPDLLLLDEPTNHLDLRITMWLEQYLASFPGAILVISHDRYFLDKLVQKTIDLDRGTTRVYKGNYSEFTVKKQALFDDQMKAYENQQRMLKHEKEVILRFRSYNRERFFKKAQSREKLLSHVELLEKPRQDDNEMLLRLRPNVESGNDVLQIEGLSKGFAGRTLFSGLDLHIRKGEHVTLIGDNGTGKTTLVKMITGVLPPDTGRIKVGVKVYFGYFDQEHAGLSDHKTAFSEIHDAHPDFTETKVRSLLGAFLFSGDDVFKEVRELSGGEKSRLSLLKLMLSKANFLLLDEPTNHLDMQSREVLEDAVRSYEGTVLSVTHDRYYMNAVSSRIIELYKGKLITYDGDYDYYLEKRDLFHSRIDSESPALSAEKTLSESERYRKERKEQDAKIRKRQHDLENLEKAIASREAEIASIDREMEIPGNQTDAEYLMKLSSSRTSLSEELDGLYEKWAALQEEAL